MNSKNRIAHGVALLSALGLLMSMNSCAAPDAQPGPEIKPTGGAGAGGAGGGSGGGSTGGDGGSGPVEPPAGNPVWALGFGAVNDQQSFDVASASPTSVVATIGFIGSIGVPNVGMFTPGNPNVRNILVASFANDGTGAIWGQHIKCAGEITRSVVTVDSLGNTIVAGGFNGSLELENLDPTLPAASNYDAYIAKFDPTGKPTWVQPFGETYFEYVTDVATDGDGNIIVVGVTEGDAYKFGTTMEGIDVMPAPVTMNPLDDNIFVAKFDPNGKVIWAKRLGLAAENNIAAGAANWLDPAVTVTVSPKDGSIIVGGAFEQTITLGSDQITAKGHQDAFIAKFGADGKNDWHMEFGDDGVSQRVRSIALTSTDEIVVTGWFQGTIPFAGEGNSLKSYKNTKDLLVLKLAADKTLLWARGYPSPGDQMGTTVLVDQKDQPIVLGSFTGVLDLFNGQTLVNTNFGPITDLFSAKFSANGTPFWAHAYGDLMGKTPDNQNVGGAVLGKNGTEDLAIVAGMNRGTLDLGGNIDPLQSLGAEDAYLMAITY